MALIKIRAGTQTYFLEGATIEDFCKTEVCGAPFMKVRDRKMKCYKFFNINNVSQIEVFDEGIRLAGKSSKEDE